MVRPHQFVWIISIGFLLGVAVGVRFILPLLSIGIAIGLLVLVLLFRPNTPIKIIGFFLLAMLIGWWRCQAILSDRPVVTDLNNITATVIGTITSDPEINGNQQKLHLRVSSVDEEPRQFAVLLTAWHLPQFEYADQISGRFKFSLPQNSDEFQYSNYLAKDNIYLTANQAGDLTIVASHPWTLLGQLYKIKHWTDWAIHRFLPEPHSGLLAGLLLGIKSDLPDTFRTALKNSGTSHIVALSGFNVTIIITFLLFILRGLPRRLVWIVSGILILGFVIMTGAASSVVRAAIMGWILLLAGWWGRKRHPINAILVAVSTMVFLHPLILFYDVGFQLSVAATIGLMYGTPSFQKIRWIPKFITEALSATIGATVFTLPLIALYFGGISWVTLGANLIVVPLVPYVMLIGCAGLVAFIGWPKLVWLNLLVWPLSALLFAVISWFGDLPSAFIPLPPIPGWIPVFYYLGLGLIIFYVRYHRQSAQTVV